MKRSFQAVQTCSLFMLITLDAQSEESSEPMVVIASRIEEDPLKSAGSSVAVTGQKMRQEGDVTLVESLQREPGVSIPLDDSGVDGFVPFLQGGTKGLNIRGLEGNRINIQVDGIRQPEEFSSLTFGGSGGPSRIFFDPATLSQIEVFKSASSSQYGSDALAGTVLARTESAETLLGEDIFGTALNAGVTYSGINDSVNTRVAGAAGNEVYAASLVYSFREGHERANHDNSPERFPVDFTSNAFVLSGEARWGDLRVKPTVDYYHSESETTFDEEAFLSQGVVLSESGVNVVERERIRSSVNLDWDVNSDWLDSLALQLYWQDASSFVDNTQVTEARDRTSIVSYNTEIYGLQLSARHSFEALGLFHEFQWGWDLSSSFVDTQLDRTDIFFDGSVEADITPNIAPSDVVRNGVYFSDKILVGSEERLELTLGARLDYISINPENELLNTVETSFFDENTFAFVFSEVEVQAVDYENTVLSPNINLLYHLSDELNIYGSVSRGFRNPTAEELNGVITHAEVGLDGLAFLTLPNPDLEEESSWSYELGLQYRNDAISWALTGFYNDYDNFQQSGVETGEVSGNFRILTTENRQAARIYGLEAKFDWDLGESYASLEGLSVGASYGWSEGTFETEDDGRQPLNTVEPWKVAHWVGYDDPSETWGAKLTGSYHARKDPDDIFGDFTPTDSYYLLDLVGHYNVTDSFTVRAGLKNLLNQEYVLWTRSNSSNGHNGSVSNGQETQAGTTGFVSLSYNF